MPTSRARTAICSAPFECPSRPGLPTRIRIGWPICSETSSTRSRTPASRSPLTEPPRRPPPTPVGRAVVAEDLAQDAGPLAGGGAGLGGLDRRRHDVAPLVAGGLGELLERRVDGALVALGLPLLERLDPLALDLGVGGEDAAVLAGGERRVLGLGEPVLADHLDLAALDPGDPLAVRLDQPRLHVGDRLDGAAVLGDHLHLGVGALGQLLDQAVHHHRALEDVGVVEQVGLVGEDLLDPQAPLLVPGAGQAERLVPGRQLDRAGAGVAAERHGERLEHDPRHVVLGLGLGQAERVDLDAVAEAQELRLGDAVALAADLLPERGPSRAAWRAPR